ncbi:pseudouridine synthase [Cardiobacterium hominis]
MTTLPILYRDAHLIAVNKPAGLLVHRSPLERYADETVLQILQEQTGLKGYPAHRLDRPTSGVLLFALDPTTARLLGELIAQQRLEKTYHAIVRGWLAEAGEIDYPLTYLPDKMADRNRQREKPPQEALTRYRCLVRSELPFASDGKHPTSRYSLAELRPLQGRKHQLRRHLKHIFHPIIGDTTHGDNRQNRVLGERYGALRLMLHASRLQLPHPHTGAPLDLHAPFDAHWAQLAAALALNINPP